MVELIIPLVVGALIAGAVLVVPLLMRSKFRVVSQQASEPKNKLSWELFSQVLGATVVFQFVAIFLMGLRAGVETWLAILGWLSSTLLLIVAIFSLSFFWPVLFFALYRSPYPEHHWRVWGAWMALSVAEIAFGAGSVPPIAYGASLDPSYAYRAGPLLFFNANYFYAMVWLGTPVIALIGALLGNWLFHRLYDVAPLSR